MEEVVDGFAESLVALAGDFRGREIWLMFVAHPHVRRFTLEVSDEASPAMVCSQDAAPADAVRLPFMQRVHETPVDEFGTTLVRFHDL
jgi:hypothetical protein